MPFELRHGAPSPDAAKIFWWVALASAFVSAGQSQLGNFSIDAFIKRLNFPGKTPMRFKLPAALAIFVLVLAQTAEARRCSLNDTPLPDNIRVASPSGGTFDAFLGTWIGAWVDVERGKIDGLCHTLIVQSVDSLGNTRIIYGWANYKPWRLKRGYTLENGTITSDGKLIATLSNGVCVEYTLANGKLHGVYAGGTPGFFSRIDVNPSN